MENFFICQDFLNYKKIYFKFFYTAVIIVSSFTANNENNQLLRHMIHQSLVFPAPSAAISSENVPEEPMALLKANSQSLHLFNTNCNINFSTLQNDNINKLCRRKQTCPTKNDTIEQLPNVMAVNAQNLEINASTHNQVAVAAAAAAAAAASMQEKKVCCNEL